MYKRIVEMDAVVLSDRQDDVRFTEFKECFPDSYFDSLVATVGNRLMALLRGANGIFRLQRDGSKSDFGSYSFFDSLGLWGKTRRTVYYYSRWIRLQNGVQSGEVQWK